MELSFGEIFVWEMLGTAVLILLGAGVVANRVLRNALGRGDSWLLIAVGWGFAVFAGATVANPSGGHLNPAVTIGLLVSGSDTLTWGDAPAYILGQLVGAILGAALAWAAYKLQFDTHDEPENTRGIFCTGPTVPNYLWNTITEVIATFVLIIWILLNPEEQFTALGYAGVAFLVIGIGGSLGGPTGYAINPARDLGPRIAYALLPIRGKGSAEWNYSWVPVVGPLIGAVLAGLVFQILPVG